MARRRWTREELILAFDLYCRIPFGRIHIHNPDIIALAEIIGRTPSAVSWKLANFARFDPALQSRNVKGAVHGSAADEDIWNEFREDGENLVLEAQQIFAEKRGQPLPAEHEEPDGVAEVRLGFDRDTTVKTRIGQSFFRAAVLASYNWTCCITGLRETRLLNASHIAPWSADIRNRVNPCNGLCLNALHDRAFDRGLMTISAEYCVVFASEITAQEDEPLNALLLCYANRKLNMPERFRPDPELLRYHCEKIFLG